MTPVGPISFDRSLRGRVPVFFAVAVAIENGELEIRHDIRVGTCLKSPPDLLEFVFDDPNVSLIWRVRVSDGVESVLDLLWGARHDVA